MEQGAHHGLEFLFGLQSEILSPGFSFILTLEFAVVERECVPKATYLIDLPCTGNFIDMIEFQDLNL